MLCINIKVMTLFVFVVSLKVIVIVNICRMKMPVVTTLVCLFGVFKHTGFYLFYVTFPKEGVSIISLMTVCRATLIPSIILLSVIMVWITIKIMTLFVFVVSLKVIDIGNICRMIMPVVAKLVCLFLGDKTHRMVSIMCRIVYRRCVNYQHNAHQQSYTHPIDTCYWVSFC
jgi:hypothetical protein